MIPSIGIIAALSLLVGGGIAYSQLRRSAGHYFDSNGVRLFYSERGSGTPVILLHGFGAHGDTNFRNPGTVAALAKNYRVIMMDARGHGRSEKPHDPESYGMEVIDDVRRLMDHLEIERAHLVGYSMGALFALKFMTVYPERLITASPCGNGWHLEDDPQAQTAERLAADLAAGRGYHALFELIDPLNGPIHPLVKQVLHIYFQLANDSRALAQMVEGWRQFELTEEDIKAVSVPTLCVIGENDPLRLGAERLANTKSNHELVLLKNRNHYNSFKREFIENVQTFLAKHPAPAAAEMSPN
jgi:pimeloyl-ACP methyl ester carboxylesterase